MFGVVNDSYGIVANPDEAKQALGANLRRLRVAHHLSLSQLARATGVSKATLSGIERGGANPTVETLAALAGTLSVAVGELLERTELAPVQIVRRERVAAGERREPSWRTLDELALGSGFHVAELRLPPHHVERLDPRAPGARTLIYVIQGKPIAGPVERASELAAGDYASFPADVPHQIETGARPASVMLLARTPGSA
jgi:transcriptional regulator with XRE-family HTH domain